MSGNGHGLGRRNTPPPLGLQFAFEGSWTVIKTTEPCYIMAWWHGIVPNKDPKRLAAAGMRVQILGALEQPENPRGAVWSPAPSSVCAKA